MVAIDVRSLVKRAKAERVQCSATVVNDKSSDILAAEALRHHSSQQVPIELAKHSLKSDLQVSLRCC